MEVNIFLDKANTTDCFPFHVLVDHNLPFCIDLIAKIGFMNISNLVGQCICMKNTRLSESIVFVRSPK